MDNSSNTQNGAQGGAQSDGNIGVQTTATNSVQAEQTAGAGLVTSTVVSSSTTTPTQDSTPTSIPTAAASSSSNSNKAVIAGGVVGGLAGLFLIFLALVWFLNRRQKKRLIARKDAEPVSYENLNEAYNSESFAHQNDRNSYNTPPSFSAGAIAYNSNPDTRGEQHPYAADENYYGGTYALPSYAQSQASVSGGLPLRQLNTFQQQVPSTSLQPTRSQYQGNTPVNSPESDQPPFSLPQSRDPIAFAMSQEASSLQRQSTPALPLIAPIPRHPISQTDLERSAGEALRDEQRPQSAVSRAESPGRGFETVSLYSEVSEMPRNGGLQRGNTQRTVSTVSSLGVSVIHETELESLGVGRH